MQQINKSKIFIILASLMMVLGVGLAGGESVSARGFSGGHSFGGTHSVTRSYGGTHTSPSRSFHTYRSTTKPSTTYRSPSNSHSSVIRKSTPSSTTGSTKTYRVNRNNSVSHNTYNSYNNRREGLGTMFGHSIVRGAGWSIGSNMGNSIWHQTFGFGGNQYYDDNGQVQYARRGFGGWFVLLFFIAIIALVIFLIRRVQTSGSDRHHY